MLGHDDEGSFGHAPGEGVALSGDHFLIAAADVDRGRSSCVMVGPGDLAVHGDVELEGGRPIPVPIQRMPDARGHLGADQLQRQARASIEQDIVKTGQLRGGVNRDAGFDAPTHGAHQAGQSVGQPGASTDDARPSVPVSDRTEHHRTAVVGGRVNGVQAWADEAVSTTTGWWRMDALTTRARVAITQREPEQAERDAHEALTGAAEIKAYLLIPDILECLATSAGEDGSHREAARLFGAVDGIRQCVGRGPVQGLGRRLRGLGGGVARCDG